MAETKKYSGFTPEERAAMKERARELKAATTKADGEREVLEKIAGMAGSDREMAERVHAAITGAAPQLDPRLWYGSPAYALDGKVICFFQESTKFTTRYATLGFSDAAMLDDGAMWPSSYAIQSIDADVEKTIRALVKKAVAAAGSPGTT